MLALTAFQGLSGGGDTVHSGQNVLINGAAGDDVLHFGAHWDWGVGMRGADRLWGGRGSDRRLQGGTRSRRARSTRRARRTDRGQRRRSAGQDVDGRETAEATDSAAQKREEATSIHE